MIKGMNRTVLIPILLSTFLLVGCETETEFDRCFEANGGNAEFDYALFMEKANSSFPEEDEPVENTLETIKRLKQSKERRRIFESSLTAIELEFHRCRTKRTRAICLSEVESKNKNRAKAICHSQGIY
jgi:hypothetical protein